MDAMQVIEILICALLVIVGVLIVFSKNIVKSIILLSMLSMMAAVAFVILKAPDVAITEVVIGSGLITFLFLVTVKGVQKVGDSK